MDCVQWHMRRSVSIPSEGVERELPHFLAVVRQRQLAASPRKPIQCSVRSEAVSQTADAAHVVQIRAPLPLLLLRAAALLKPLPARNTRSCALIVLISVLNQQIILKVFQNHTSATISIAFSQSPLDSQALSSASMSVLVARTKAWCFLLSFMQILPVASCTLCLSVTEGAVRRNCVCNACAANGLSMSSNSSSQSGSRGGPHLALLNVPQQRI